ASSNAVDGLIGTYRSAASAGVVEARAGVAASSGTALGRPGEQTAGHQIWVDLAAVDELALGAGREACMKRASRPRVGGWGLIGNRRIALQEQMHVVGDGVRVGDDDDKLAPFTR